MLVSAIAIPQRDPHPISLFVPDVSNKPFLLPGTSSPIRQPLSLSQ
jgi:hypothetical protein